MGTNHNLPNKDHLTAALELWAQGDYYEAHEELEEVTDDFEDDDAAFEITIALVHVAAALHKLKNRVGEGAVPGKIDGALEVLQTAPSDFCGLAMPSFISQLRTLRARLDGLAQGGSIPPGLKYPLLERG